MQKIENPSIEANPIDSKLFGILIDTRRGHAPATEWNEIEIALRFAF